MIRRRQREGERERKKGRRRDIEREGEIRLIFEPEIFKRTFIFGIRVKNHLLNYCSRVVNSRRFFL